MPTIPTIAERRARLVKLIHVGKSQTLLADDEYRALVRRVSGGAAESSTDLDLAQLEDLLREVKGRGFVVRQPKAAGSRRRLNDEPTSRKIRALWLDMHAAGIVRSADEASLAKYVKRLTGVEDLRWLSSAQAARVIETLKSWQERTTSQATTEAANAT